jgi:hypothetical protein
MQGAVAPAAKERLTSGQKWSIALSLLGALVCLPAAAFFGFALGHYPSRMECTPQTMGSGCYEGELLYASVIFAVFFAPFFLASLNVALKHRRKTRPLTNWWPLTVLSAVTLTVVVLAAGSAIANPNEYF